MTRPNHAHWLLALVAALICGGCGKTESDTDDLDSEAHVPISTCAELQAMQNDLAGHYVLVNDIDCSGVDFEPVGSQESPFTGTLDGQGFVISALSIDRPSDDRVGLFAVTRSATIRNVESLAATRPELCGRSIWACRWSSRTRSG